MIKYSGGKLVEEMSAACYEVSSLNYGTYLLVLYPKLYTVIFVFFFCLVEHKDFVICVIFLCLTTLESDQSTCFDVILVSVATDGACEHWLVYVDDGAMSENYKHGGIYVIAGSENVGQSLRYDT